jgi:hypothetical protein
VSSPRLAHYDHAVQVRDSVYEIQIPLDVVERGTCGWTIAHIEYSVEKVGVRGWSPQRLLRLTDAAPRARGAIDITCHFRLPAEPSAVQPAGGLGCRVPAEVVVSPSVSMLEVNVRDAG